jgi:hypothetical protein
MLSGRCLDVKGDRDGHPPRLAGGRAASRLGLRIRRRSNWAHTHIHGEGASFARTGLRIRPGRPAEHQGSARAGTGSSILRRRSPPGPPTPRSRASQPWAPGPTRTGALGPGIWSNLPQVGVGADRPGSDGLRAGRRPCPEREPYSKTVGLPSRPAARLRSRPQLSLRASSTRRQCLRRPARAGPGERRGGRHPAGAAAGNRLARRQAPGWRGGAARRRSAALGTSRPAPTGPRRSAWRGRASSRRS